MKSRKFIWIVLFIVGLAMILKSYDLARWIGSEMSCNIAGAILSVVSGSGLLLELYKKRK